jgi:hypothetical protein
VNDTTLINNCVTHPALKEINFVGLIFSSQSKSKAMMHSNDSYSFWGMHLVGWFFIIVCLVIMVGWMIRFQKRK